MSQQRQKAELFFFKAEDGIRDYKVTRVQTCALPIWVHVTDADEDGRPGERQPLPPEAGLGVRHGDGAVDFRQGSLSGGFAPAGVFVRVGMFAFHTSMEHWIQFSIRTVNLNL